MVTVEAPRSPSGIDIKAVDYALVCLGADHMLLDNNDVFADEITLEGTLTRAGEGSADYGQGRVPTELWRHHFGGMPIGPCTIEVRARTERDEVVCTAEYDFDLTSEAVTRLRASLPCATP